MPLATITSKGQITLPKEVRDHFHLGEGDRVEFVIETGGAVQVRPVSGAVQELFGLLRRVGARPATDNATERVIARSVIEDDLRIRRGGND
jgi:antitoxin PrlF